MGRFLIFLSYIGTRYSGFQKQFGNKVVKTIQGQVDVALKSLNPANEIKSFPSSRTDAGVHALENTLHVDLIHKNPEIKYDPLNLKIKLNQQLRKYGDTISVTNVLHVPDDFHSQMKVVKRTYLYRLAIPWKTIDNYEGYTSMNFFESERAQIILKPVDIEKLIACAELMVGTHDFTAFTTIKSLREQNKDPMKKLSIGVKLGSSPFNKYNNPGLEIWEIHVSSRSFLFRQVRRMIGTMIQTSMGYFTLDDVKYMLLHPDLNETEIRIKPARAHGLYLKNVYYDPNDLIYDPNSQPKEKGHASRCDLNAEDPEDT